MKVLQCVTLLVVLTCVLAWRPKGPKRPKGPPPPPIFPPGPIGPVGPTVPPGGGGGGGGGGTGTCFTGQADASACENFVLPDASGLGPFGPDVAATESSGFVSANSNCGDNARSYYEEYEANGSRYIITSGVPDHPAECGAPMANPNVRCERWQWVKLPMTWADSGTEYKTMGTTGYVMSGGAVFDHRSSPFGDLAACNEWISLDPSHGHSDPSKQYHYHAVPTMYSNAADPGACEHIGYMRDGGKLFGLCGLQSCYKLKEGVEEGSAENESDYEFVQDENCQLDECNMAEKDGEMAYFFSPNWPYVPPCLKGQVSAVNGLTGV